MELLNLLIRYRIYLQVITIMYIPKPSGIYIYIYIYIYILVSFIKRKKDPNRSNM